MFLLWLLLGASLLCFGGVLLFGAPYVPTLTPQVVAALDLADLQADETLLELGCGDGKVLVAAAERGFRAVGYELNPILAVTAWVRTRKYRGRVVVRCANFWTADWPEAQAIFVFLLPKYMKKLDTKIERYGKNSVKLVSFAFMIPGKKVSAQKKGVFLYIYP